MGNESKLLLIEYYLQSATDIVTSPWLKPQDAFWRMIDPSRNQRTFRVAENVALMTRSKSVIAATENMLFWIDMGTMTVTREKVITEGRRSHKRTFALCLREKKEILVLGFNTGEFQFRNERNGSILRAIPNAHKKNSV